jgi:hypothetical protein
MSQKRKLQAVWDDNRSKSSPAPTLNWICKKSDGTTPCTGARVDSGPESYVYDNDGETSWVFTNDHFNTKWTITETYTTPVTVKTIINIVFYCSTTYPCRVYIGDHVDYTQNTKCGAD